MNSSNTLIIPLIVVCLFVPSADYLCQANQLTGHTLEVNTHTHKRSSYEERRRSII